MASTLSVKEILQALDALSDEGRARVRQYLEHEAGQPLGEPLSALLATWDESISLQTDVEDDESVWGHVSEQVIDNRRSYFWRVAFSQRAGV